jgi:hypothetical protein
MLVSHTSPLSLAWQANTATPRFLRIASLLTTRRDSAPSLAKPTVGTIQVIACEGT